MKTDNELLVGYLLGDLAAAEVESVESRYFADDDFYVVLEVLEEGLIRDYLCGNLSSDDRRRFERKYLSNPSLRERVEFSAAVMKAASPPKRPLVGQLRRFLAWRAERGFQLVLATVIVALCVVVWQELRIRQFAASRQPGALSFLLSPGMTRSDLSRSTILRVPRGTADLTLQLELSSEGASSDYRVKIETPELIQVWSGLVSRVALGRRVVEVTLPSTVLRTGDYIVTLDSVAEGLVHETYTFRALQE